MAAASDFGLFFVSDNAVTIIDNTGKQLRQIVGAFHYLCCGSHSAAAADDALYGASSDGEVAIVDSKGIRVVASAHHEMNVVAFDLSRKIVYFAGDPDKNRIYSLSLADGRVVPLAGAAESGSADGDGSAARFDQPFSMAVEGNGSLLVADRSGSLRRIVFDLAVSTPTPRPSPAPPPPGPRSFIVGRSCSVGASSETLESAEIRSDGNLRVNLLVNASGFQIDQDGYTSIMDDRGSSYSPGAWGDARGERAMGKVGMLTIANPPVRIWLDFPAPPSGTRIVRFKDGSCEMSGLSIQL